MPLLLQMLWLLVLTHFGAREQVKFSQRPRPAIIHIPPNQGLFGLLATFGIPSMVATGLFFPSWSLLFVVSPEMILPLGWSLALGLMITVTSALLLWINYRWAKAFWLRSTVLSILPSLLWATLVAGVFVLYPERLVKIGTYSEFWSLKAQPLIEHPWFWVQTGLATAATLGLYWLWRRLEVQATR